MKSRGGRSLRETLTDAKVDIFLETDKEKAKKLQKK